VFVAAGAAGVIASLWAVDDYASALLMSHFYELISNEETDVQASPAAALRDAQLWLRDLTADAETDYLSERPLLRAHREESAARGRRRGGTDRPYSDVSLWAPFTFTGA
jgi:CHAT domain-containing protein